MKSEDALTCAQEPVPEAGVTIESIDKPPDDAEGAESGQKPPESPV